MSDTIFNTETNKWECPLCGMSHKNKFKHNCKGKPPGIIKKIFNFTEAMADHVADGLTLRSKEEIEEILTLCRSNKCGYYNNKTESCNACGCPITASRNFFSKLAQKSGKCPKGFW